MDDSERHILQDQEKLKSGLQRIFIEKTEREIEDSLEISYDGIDLEAIKASLIESSQEHAIVSVPEFNAHITIEDSNIIRIRMELTETE